MDELKKNSIKVVTRRLEEVNTAKNEFEKAKEEWKEYKSNLLKRIGKAEDATNYMETKLLELLSTFSDKKDDEKRIQLPYYFLSIAEKSKKGNLFDGYMSLDEKDEVIEEIIKYKEFFLSGICTVYLRLEGYEKDGEIDYLKKLTSDSHSCWVTYNRFIYMYLTPSGPTYDDQGVEYFTGREAISIGKFEKLYIDTEIYPAKYTGLYPVKVCWLQRYCEYTM